MADAMKKSCVKDGLTNRSAAIFPDGRPFRDLRLWFSVINTGEVAQGCGAPVTIDQVFLGEYPYPDESSHSVGVDPFPHKPWREMHLGVVNVSCKISKNFQTASLDTKEPTEISAEGTYNSGSGLLCLIGCRYVDSFEDAKETRNKDSMDCEIVINIRYTPLNAEAGEKLKGMINCRREKADPFFFDPSIRYLHTSSS